MGKLIVAVLALCGFAAPAVEITKDWQIVIPDPEPRGVQRALRMAADEIRLDMEECAGLALPVVTKSKARKGPAIFLGAEFAEAAGFMLDNFTWYDNTVAEKDGCVYLFGKDYPGRAGNNVLWRHCVLPTMRAATRFLGDFAGVKFLLPGRVGREIPRREKIVVPDGIRSDEHPKQIYGSGGCYNKDVLWYYAHGYWPSGAFKSYGGHSYPAACPREKYYETHPEYFALFGGKRVAHASNPSLCVSNPSVQDLILAELIRNFDEGATACQLAQQDGFKPCECENCRALYGTGDDWREKLWLLHRDIAARAEKLRPGKIVHIISYGPTARPPKTFKKFPSNVMIELCSYSEESFREWKEYEVPHGFTIYIYEWGNYIVPGFVARRSFARLVELTKRWRDNNVKGIFRCGSGECPGCEGPILWVFNHLIENPEASPEALLSEYVEAAFGPAADQMRRFYLEQDRRLRYFDILQDGFPVKRGDLWQLRVKPEEAHLLFFPRESVQLREEALTRAETTPGLTAKQKKRLELVRVEFDYAKALGRIAPLYRAYQECPSKALFEPLAGALLARKAVLDGIYKGQRYPQPLEGWPELPLFRGDTRRSIIDMNARLGATMGSPLTWDVDYMRKNGILPGTDVKRTTAVRAAVRPVDTDFTKGVWVDQPWNDLGGIQLEPPKTAARFKVAYDDENVYFAVESDLKDDCVVAARGIDSSMAAVEENVDFLFAPGPTRDVCYHLLYNPVPNSRYDLALGLITDSLDPMYGKFDSQWNGDWTTLDRREGNRWYTLLTVPYSTIRVAPPKPGDRWYLNVGRATNMGRDFSTDVILALWSPNLESRSFCSPTAMGELVFK